MLQIIFNGNTCTLLASIQSLSPESVPFEFVVTDHTLMNRMKDFHKLQKKPKKPSRASYFLFIHTGLNKTPSAENCRI